jgi:hypothetical protein
MKVKRRKCLREIIDLKKHRHSRNDVNCRSERSEINHGKEGTNSVVENDAKNNCSPLVGRFVIGERSALVGRFDFSQRFFRGITLVGNVNWIGRIPRKG